MAVYSREDIEKIVEEEDVEFIRLQFTDIFGVLKNVAITSSQLGKALDNKCMFDGSALEGFVRIEESDMYLHPDLDSFAIFPWRPQNGKVARFICDVYTTDGVPSEGDPRYILKKAIQKADDMGFRLNVGPECEFFLFHTDDDGQPTTLTHEKAGYFDLGPVDRAENVRRDIILTLEEMGFEIEASHHEIAPAQHEIDFKYDEALATADKLLTFKLAVKTIAQRHGLHATFMPKPKRDTCGSGMHINLSLADKTTGINIFEDLNGKLGLSEYAYHFMAGIIQHMKAITAIANPLVNSYKRMVAGFEAPLYIAWSATNRSPLIRIPSSRGQSTRIELRSPDAAANPYLLLALCLEAGLEGIRTKAEPLAGIDCNIFDMTDDERSFIGIEKLPTDLCDAVNCLKSDRFILDVLGSKIAHKYVEAKEKEWQLYNMQVTQWELDQYLGKY